jgi:hypothetical protein
VNREGLVAESPAPTAGRAWIAGYWVLTTFFILTAIISTQKIRAGFLSNYAADVTCPAWLYLTLRGLHGRGQTVIGRYFAATPERAAVVLFGGSTLTELSQIWWPAGFFSGTYDPLDILAYGIGVGACYGLERLSMSTSASSG